MFTDDTVMTLAVAEAFMEAKDSNVLASDDHIKEQLPEDLLEVLEKFEEMVK